MKYVDVLIVVLGQIFKFFNLFTGFSVQLQTKNSEVRLLFDLRGWDVIYVGKNHILPHF